MVESSAQIDYIQRVLVAVFIELKRQFPTLDLAAIKKVATEVS